MLSDGAIIILLARENLLECVLFLPEDFNADRFGEA
jgi:hypothetical protein